MVNLEAEAVAAKASSAEAELAALKADLVGAALRAALVAAPVSSLSSSPPPPSPSSPAVVGGGPAAAADEEALQGRLADERRLTLKFLASRGHGEWCSALGVH